MNRTLWMALGIQLVMGLCSGVARAECSQDFEGSRQAALEDSEQCEVDGGFYQKLDGSWDFYCNTAFHLDVCEELSNTIDCLTMSADACDVAMGDVYEGCLALAGMTGAVKP